MTDDGDLDGPSPEPGPGGDAHDRAELGATSGNGNGHHPGSDGTPERSPWAAPAWDAGSAPGERPEPLRAVVSGSAGPEGDGPGPAAVMPAPEPPGDGLARPPGHGPFSPAPDGPGPPWGHPPAGPPAAATSPPTHRWGLGAYLLVEALFLLASAAVAAVLGDRLTSSAGALAVALAVPTVLAAATALLITRVRGNGPGVDLGLRWSWRDVGRGLVFGFGGLVITIPASILYLAIAGTETTSAVGEEFNGVRSGPALAAVVFVIVVFVAPLCEEIVYRGLLWGAVERLGAQRWWALGITTVVFALAHFELTRTPLLFVVAIPIALARLYTGRLVASVVAHGVNNLLPAVALVLMLLGVLPGT
jgi:uncharacterized protein